MLLWNHQLKKFRDFDSELLLKILNKIFIETKNSEDNELFVDENWKINSKYKYYNSLQ